MRKVKQKLFEYVKQIEEPYREAVLLYLKNKPEFKRWPASIYYHHPQEGGLMVHTLEVCQVAVKILEAIVKDEWKSDMILAAVLHDVGKIKLYKALEPGDKGYAGGKRFDYRYGKNQVEPHSVISIVDWLRETSQTLPERVQDAIYSHEGGWSDCKYPETVFESVLHAADLISSRNEGELDAIGD